MKTLLLPLQCILIAFSLRSVGGLAASFHKKKCNTGTRRSFLTKNGFNVLLILSTTTPSHILALEDKNEEDSNPFTSNMDYQNKRPFAPREALLPVTRLKIWFDDVYLTSCNLASTNKDDKNEQYKIINDLNTKLSNPPKLFYSEKKVIQRPTASTAQLTNSISAANKDEYQLNRKNLNIGDKMAAVLNQADVQRQWGMLQYAESKREESNEMRAAFNFYTKQLTFGDNYILTASKEERKNLIRNDKLPSLTAVITSDLDQRDLYRNQFLTAIEDARAEVAYQAAKKQSSGVEEIEVVDIIDLVNEASAACENWFRLISEQDLKDAMDQLL